MRSSRRSCTAQRPRPEQPFCDVSFPSLPWLCWSVAMQCIRFVESCRRALAGHEGVPVSALVVVASKVDKVHTPCCLSSARDESGSRLFMILACICRIHGQPQSNPSELNSVCLQGILCCGLSVHNCAMLEIDMSFTVVECAYLFVPAVWHGREWPTCCVPGLACAKLSVVG